MNNVLYNKLVDLYAGRELPAELEEQMELAGEQDAALQFEMSSMRNVVDTLHQLDAPEYTEESYQRILMKLYARGAEIQTHSPEPSHFQYHLPLQG